MATDGPHDPVGRREIGRGSDPERREIRRRERVAIGREERLGGGRGRAGSGAIRRGEEERSGVRKGECRIVILRRRCRIELSYNLTYEL